jgi:hypothetical protein
VSLLASTEALPWDADAELQAKIWNTFVRRNLDGSDRYLLVGSSHDVTVSQKTKNDEEAKDEVEPYMSAITE